MDTIKFVIEHYRVEEFEYDLPVINIYINGQNLIDQVTQIEQKDWDGQADTRSGYIGIEVSRLHRFRDEMLGNKHYPHSVLLTCTCTIEECNCLMADIAFEADRVAWRNLRSPWLSNSTYSPFVDVIDAAREGWVPVDYSGLGPFTFDREQYLGALEQVTEECRRRPPEVRPDHPDWNSLLDLLNGE